MWALLGYGRAAVRLARSPRQQQEAVECCLASPRIEDAEAGLQLARTTGADASATAPEARRLASRPGCC